METEQCEICPKVNNKDTRATSVTDFSVSVVDFEQVNAGWVWNTYEQLIMRDHVY